jgi:hypothetical protein
MVLFFVATLVFFGLRRLTEGEGAAVVAAAQVGALLLIVGLILLVVRRLR